MLLAMKANVEDRGSKGDCTPLMEAASGGFVDIVRLLLHHNANVNAQSSSGMFLIDASPVCIKSGKLNEDETEKRDCLP